MAFDTCNDGDARIDGFNIVKFLDLWIYASWLETMNFPVNKNDLFAFSGIPGLIVKTAFLSLPATRPHFAKDLHRISKHGSHAINRWVFPGALSIFT